MRPHTPGLGDFGDSLLGIATWMASVGLSGHLRLPTLSGRGRHHSIRESDNGIDLSDLLDETDTLSCMCLASGTLPRTRSSPWKGKVFKILLHWRPCKSTRMSTKSPSLLDSNSSCGTLWTWYLLMCWRSSSLNDHHHHWRWPTIKTSSGLTYISARSWPSN